MANNRQITPEAEEIGKRLHEYILAKYGGPAAAARAWGKSYVQIRQYVRGLSKPGYEILSILARDGCDITWLLTGEEHKEERDVRQKLRVIQEMLDALNSGGDEPTTEE